MRGGGLYVGLLAELVTSTKNKIHNGIVYKTEFLISVIPICFSTYAASSVVARGIIPGSDKLVLKREDIVNINNNPPIIGIAIVTFSAKY